MLAPQLLDAVAQGRFHIHTAAHVSEGIDLLIGLAAGEPGVAGHYPHNSVLGHAQEALQAFRRACQQQEDPRSPRRHFGNGEAPRKR